MNQSAKLGLVIVGCVIGLTVGVAVLIQTVLASWHVSTMSSISPALEETLEALVDEEIDSGYADPAFDPSEPLLVSRKILIHHNINARTAKDVTARLFYLDGLDSKSPIDLYLSTQGGWGDSAFTIIDAMRMIEAPVNTWAIGGCYSSGALILSAGTGRRFATENTIIMIHANLTDSDGPYTYERLGRRRYERVWQETSSLPDEWFPMTADLRYYFDPEEALELNVIDEIVTVWSDE